MPKGTDDGHRIGLKQQRSVALVKTSNYGREGGREGGFTAITVRAVTTSNYLHLTAVRSAGSWTSLDQNLVSGVVHQEQSGLIFRWWSGPEQSRSVFSLRNGMEW